MLRPSRATIARIGVIVASAGLLACLSVTADDPMHARLDAAAAPFAGEDRTSSWPDAGTAPLDPVAVRFDAIHQRFDALEGQLKRLRDRLSAQESVSMQHNGRIGFIEGFLFGDVIFRPAASQCRSAFAPRPGQWEYPTGSDPFPWIRIHLDTGAATRPVPVRRRHGGPGEGAWPRVLMQAGLEVEDRAAVRVRAFAQRRRGRRDPAGAVVAARPAPGHGRQVVGADRMAVPRAAAEVEAATRDHRARQAQPAGHPAAPPGAARGLGEPGAGGAS